MIHVVMCQQTATMQRMTREVVAGPGLQVPVGVVAGATCQACTPALAAPWLLVHHMA